MYVWWMTNNTRDLWLRYMLLEAERCALACGISDAPDPDKRHLDVQSEQAQLKAAIGEPTFSELAESDL